MDNQCEKAKELEQEITNLKTEITKLSEMYETGITMLISTNQIIQSMTQRQDDCYEKMKGRNNKVLSLVYVSLAAVAVIIGAILFLHTAH